VSGLDDRIPTWEPDGDDRVDALPPLDDLPWRPAYDRESIERFAAELAAEERRLRTEIEAARGRTAAAATSTPVDPRDLGALMLAVQDELEALEADHRRLLDGIRAAAEAEAARVLESAREEVAGVRRTAAAFSDLVRGGRSGPARAVDPAPADIPGRPGQADAG
jgi:hypothetical protein